MCPKNQSHAFHITRLSLLLNTNALDSRCHDLNHIRLPDGLISIGRSAFSYNRSLASITFPASLTLIEHSAFSSCSALAADASVSSSARANTSALSS